MAAKLDMHAKLDKKESLTEHLMVIIQKNEERKAQKLEELMKKMEISEEVRPRPPALNTCPLPAISHPRLQPANLQEATEAAKRRAEIEARIAIEAELKAQEAERQRLERLVGEGADAVFPSASAHAHVHPFALL